MKNQKFESLADNAVWRRGIRHLKKKDRVLARIIEKHGAYSRFKISSDYYGTLVESFVFQQIAGKAAQAILNRFKKIYKGRIPEPREFLRTSERRIKSTGISPQKYSYIKDLATRLEDGFLELEKLPQMRDEEVVSELDKVRGIGRWTAEMFLIFSLGRTDVLPMDDLGIQKAVREAYGLRSLPSKKKFEELSRRWHPYASIASLYLWESRD